LSPFRRSSLAVFVVALALYAATTHRRVFTAGNDAARWATIESIVDHGTTSIEGSRFAGAVDQVRLYGRVYSNKPPLLAFAGAAIYAPLERLTGWSLGGAGAANVLHVVIVLLVGVPAAALVAAFHAAVREAGHAFRAWSLLLTVALGAGTLLWPFATTLNAHVPAAAALFFSWIAARRGRALAAGALCGLAAGLDLLPGAGLAPFFGWIAQRERSDKGGARFGAGFFGVALVAAVANLVHHGSVLPVKMVAGAVDLSAKAGPSLFGVVLPERASYPLEVLLGWHGLFVVSPVLLFGAWGLWIACRQTSPERAVWRALASGVVLQIAGHALLAGSYGGWSYGFRYLLPIQALLLLGAPFALERRQRWLATAFASALAVSVLFSALGAYHPWPPGYEQEASKHPVASIVRNPVGGNFAAFLKEKAPDSAIARWATRRFISADPEVARAYLRLFFGSKGDFETMRRFGS
jgi:hypothetical protein